MPISGLLGVQFDMNLLGRLTCSVVGVLVISWAYRFYSSRGKATKPQHFVRRPPDRPAEAPRETCRNCKTELRPRNAGNHNTSDDGDKQHVSDELSLDNTNRETEEGQIAELPNTQETLTEKCNVNKEHVFELKGDKPVFVEKAVSDTPVFVEQGESDIPVFVEQGESDIPVFVEQDEIKIRNVMFESTLKPCDASDSGLASPSQGQTHWILQRMQRGMAVGRELRQDLGIQGTFSSFLSKAEIRVEDANLVMQGHGDQSVVQGKIYEYYVESSSQSVTGSMVNHFERNSLDSQNVEFESGGSSPANPCMSVSPIVSRDLVLSQNPVERPCSPVSPEPRSSIKPGLIRKDSYLTAAEHSEIQIPSPTPRTETLLRPHIQAMLSGESSPVTTFSPSTDNPGTSTWKEPSLETLAGARFVNLCLENIDASELDSLKAKLDLGNCMEMLELSKKFGHASLQQAALRVMSDNYLQVLADPGLYGRLRAGERDEIQEKRVRGRQFLVAANMDPKERLGSCPEWTPSSGLYYYDDHKNSWHPLCSIPQEVVSKGCAMCTMDNYVFVAGGACPQGTKGEVKPSKRAFCYNPLTSIWKEISPMNEYRPHCKLAALQGYIYAIGGGCLHSVERYDPCSDRWTFVAPLPNDTFAVAHHVTVCNEELFVLGGTLRYTMLRYNPKTNVWRKSVITGGKERTAEIVGVGNALYRFDVNPQLGICVYRYHTVARLWYECCTKRLAHCPAFQCVAMDNTIYCLSRQFTMRFLADEISSTFTDDDLSILSVAKGTLFPFVLSLPDKMALQTSV